MLNNKTQSFSHQILNEIAIDYWKNISPKSMAISLNLLHYIYDNYVKNSQADKLRILDLGSGLSSVYFRYLKGENIQQLFCISVDDSTHWLERTKMFLKKYNLDTQNLDTVTHFLNNLSNTTYDIVIYDLGNIRTRINMAETIINQFKTENNLVIVDDCHKEHLVRELKKKGYFLKQFGPIDEFGRFACRVI